VVNCCLNFEEEGEMIESIEDMESQDFVKVTFNEGALLSDQREYVCFAQSQKRDYFNKVANNADIAQLIKGAGYQLDITTEKRSTYDFTVRYDQEEAFDAYMLLKEEVFGFWEDFIQE
jgi:hypothetical protein